jgi:GTPase Era involved in 16S rRNA processing
MMTTMNAELANLIREAIDLSDARDEQTPPLLGDDAPVPAPEALVENEDSFYLVGLIGGKDVGKSSLVNALVGEPISAASGFGRGTHEVIAYAHEAQAGAIKALLEREAPGAHRIITHSIARLYRQVLLDLPDIDSRFAEHVQLTRRMLRRMLFPLWIQSVEKYADAAPQQLLAQVAEGNDPGNFIFCINKADQLREDELSELRDDYAERLARTLRLPEPPEVCVISAAHPDRFDLPALRQRLTQQRSAQSVAESKHAAARQQDRTLLRWLDEQDLVGRSERLTRLLADAEELVATRLAAPLLEHSAPGIMDDPAHRLALADAVTDRRVSRWPIVNILHTALGPLLSLIRINLTRAPLAQLGSAEALVDAHLRLDGQPLATRIAATFAQLHQTRPAAQRLMQRRRLWEPMWAEQAADELRQALAGTIERQRQAVRSRLASPAAWLYPWRWLLTIGAVLWFPIVQPILEALLQDSIARTGRDIALLAVRIFSVTYLLSSVAFLAIYFASLWLVLRWDTQRRVGRLLARWRGIGEESNLSLAAAIDEWAQGLLDPIRDAQARTANVAARIEEYRRKTGLSAA